jgi:ATP-binding cassette subfamily B protein
MTQLTPAARSLIELAEGLSQAGQQEAALAAYRRALSLVVGQTAGAGWRAEPIAETGWTTHRSGRFALHYLAGSAAEAGVGALGTRVDAVYEAVVEQLELGDAAPASIDVDLRESAVGQPPSARAIVERGRIQAVYRPDSPGVGLERAVVEALLSASTGLRAERADFLIDGVLGHVTQVVDSLDPARLNATLRRFAAQFDAAAPDPAAEEAYGRPLAVLEQAWLESLREVQTPPMTVTALLRRIGGLLRPYWRQEALVLAAVLSTVSFTLVQPLSFSLIIDRAIVPGDYAFLALVAAGLLIFFVAQSLLSLGGEYVNHRVGERVMANLRLALFRQFQSLPMGYYARAQIGDLMSRLSSDLWTLHYALTGVLVQAAYLVLTLIFSTVLIIALEWRLALLALLALPLFFIGPRLFGARAAAASYQRQEDEAAVASAVQENLGAQGVVKAFGLQELATDAFREHVERLGRSGLRATFLATLMGSSAELAMSLINVTALAAGAFMVMQGYLTLGSLVAFTGLLASVLVPVQQLSNIYEGLQQATGGMQRIDEVLNEEARVADAPNAIELPRFAGEIRFEAVTFSYTGEQANLNELSLTIRAGQSVAIVGPSGCGKSTTLGLLLRFYDPAAGRVTIDGHDLRQVTQESLRAQIATVLQDTVLFNTSVRENIRLGRPGASDAEVEAAARSAELHDFIQSLPEGYATGVGERGARLSGGQRQRLAIARAILRDAPILLLDEATSALDPQTEAAINATLRRLAEGRTVITVTHRLDAIVQADRIVVLDRGRLAEAGRHAELLARDGLYRRLWEQQHGFVAGDAEAPVGVEAARLRAIPLFRELDEALLATLAGQFTVERFAEGATILREGEPGDRFYLIARGQVEVVTLGPTGEERRLAVLGDGDSFGEMALLRGEPRSATVRARAHCLLLALGRERFFDLLVAAPTVAEAVVRQAAARTRPPG